MYFEDNIRIYESKYPEMMMKYYKLELALEREKNRAYRERKAQLESHGIVVEDFRHRNLFTAPGEYVGVRYLKDGYLLAAVGTCCGKDCQDKEAIEYYNQQNPNVFDVADYLVIKSKKVAKYRDLAKAVDSKTLDPITQASYQRKMKILAKDNDVKEFAKVNELCKEATQIKQLLVQHRPLTDTELLVEQQLSTLRKDIETTYEKETGATTKTVEATATVAAEKETAATEPAPQNTTTNGKSM